MLCDLASEADKIVCSGDEWNEIGELLAEGNVVLDLDENVILYLLGYANSDEQRISETSRGSSGNAKKKCT